MKRMETPADKVGLSLINFSLLSLTIFPFALKFC